MSAEWQGTIITKVKVVVVVYYYCLSVGPFTILDLRQIYHTFRIDRICANNIKNGPKTNDNKYSSTYHSRATRLIFKRNQRDRL